jgi:hypothetical protein
MVSTWWHPPIVINVLWRKLPSEQGKAIAQGRRYANQHIACFECSCHIWVPQLVYFDKIHHDIKICTKMYTRTHTNTHFFFTFPLSHFSQMCKATYLVVLGHILAYDMIWPLYYACPGAGSRSWHTLKFLFYTKLLVATVIQRSTKYTMRFIQLWLLVESKSMLTHYSRLEYTSLKLRQIGADSRSLPLPPRCIIVTHKVYTNAGLFVRRILIGRATDFHIENVYRVN